MRRRYGSYMGEIRSAPENLINHDFRLAAPNQKWLTNITELLILARKGLSTPESRKRNLRRLTFSTLCEVAVQHTLGSPIGRASLASGDRGHKDARGEDRRDIFLAVNRRLVARRAKAVNQTAHIRRNPIFRVHIPSVHLAGELAPSRD